MVKLREIIYDEDDLMKKLWNSKRLFPYITLACVVLALIFLGITNNTQIYNSWEYHLSVISLELTFLFSLTGIAAYILSMVKLRRDHEHSKVKTALNIYFAFSLFVFLVLVALTIAGNAGM
jgi:CDP-diglyceride synthetase